jgi:hypothetical protein
LINGICRCAKAYDPKTLLVMSQEVDGGCAESDGRVSSATLAGVGLRRCGEEAETDHAGKGYCQESFANSHFESFSFFAGLWPVMRAMTRQGPPRFALVLDTRKKADTLPGQLTSQLRNKTDPNTCLCV